MKILLLGKSGMLGSCFLRKLVGLDCELVAFERAELDVTNFEALKLAFEKNKPDLVINCTAYTAVDEAEKNRDLAFKINAEVVGEMAKLCKKIGAVLIHFSTDYVFDGKKAQGYAEDDEAAPINVYGGSKLAGEKLIMESGADYYIIRTSWLFGPNGKNFVDTMLKLAATKPEIAVVDDQRGSPTFTEDLCEAVIKNFIENKADFGIFNLTNSGHCSWYEFARKIFEIMKIDVLVRPVSSEEFPRPARRPKYSILVNKILPRLRNWQDALKEYLS